MLGVPAEDGVVQGAGSVRGRRGAAAQTYRSRMLDSASRERPSRTARARCSPTPSTVMQVVEVGRQQLLQAAEVVDEPVDDGARQAGHLVEQAVAARADGGVQRVAGAVLKPSARATWSRSSSSAGREPRQVDEHLAHGALARGRLGR